MGYTSIGYHFGVLNRRSQAFISCACQPWQLSYAEYVILVELYRGDGRSQDDICKSLTADKALIARNVKTLEAKGYIRRRQDNADRRFKYIYLTEKAKRIQSVLLGILQRWIHETTKGMDPVLIKQTIQGLQAVARNAANLSIETLAAGKGELEK